MGNTSADGHAGEEENTSVNSLHDSESHSDDECGSVDSIGSEYPTDEETLTTSADIEPNSPPPAYSDEEYPQSALIPANMDRESPLHLLQYLTPASRSTVPAIAMLSGSSMCTVRGPIFNPVKLMLVNWDIRSAKFHPLTEKVEFLIQPAGLHVLPNWQTQKSLLIAQTSPCLKLLRNTLV
jgi:hypothetical protein